MKIILFRFESDKIHFLESDILGGEIILGEKSKFSLKENISRGKKYSEILNIFEDINKKYSPDCFAYQSPMKYRGAIKDEEGYVNSSLLHLYCETNNLKILELTSIKVREKLGISAKNFKERLGEVQTEVLQKYKIAKSDKLLDGFVYLNFVKDKIK